MQLDGSGPVRGRQGPGGASARGGIDARLMHRQTPGVWRGHEPRCGEGGRNETNKKYKTKNIKKGMRGWQADTVTTVTNVSLELVSCCIFGGANRQPAIERGRMRT
jgi:hypothetical protein